MSFAYRKTMNVQQRRSMDVIGVSDDTETETDASHNIAIRIEKQDRLVEMKMHLPSCELGHGKNIKRLMLGMAKDCYENKCCVKGWVGG